MIAKSNKLNDTTENQISTLISIKKYRILIIISNIIINIIIIKYKLISNSSE